MYLEGRFQNRSDVILIPSPFTLYGTGYFYNPENVKNLSRFHQHDAEDILQETFIKAFKAIQKFDFNISSNFSAWIYQICVRCSYDYHRKRKKRKSDRTASLSEMHKEPEAQNSSPEKLAITNQAIQQVKNAMNVLSPKQRIIFDLRHLQHNALKEIADRMQVSPSTVKKQLERAVSKLRIQLEPLWREK